MSTPPKTYRPYSREDKVLFKQNPQITTELGNPINNKYTVCKTAYSFGAAKNFKFEDPTY